MGPRSISVGFVSKRPPYNLVAVDRTRKSEVVCRAPAPLRPWTPARRKRFRIICFETLVRPACDAAYLREIIQAIQ